MAPKLHDELQPTLTERGEIQKLVDFHKTEAKNYEDPEKMKLVSRFGKIFQPIEIYQKFGEGVYGFFFLLKHLPIILVVFLFFLSPIVYLNATAKYSENSIEQKLKGNIISKFSIFNKNNLTVKLISSTNKIFSKTTMNWTITTRTFTNWKNSASTTK